MKVAAVQFQPVFGKKEVNLLQAARLVVDAAKAGARLVVLPELCTTGYSIMNKEDAWKLSENISTGPTLKVMMEVARRYNVDIVWGMVSHVDDHLFNSQVLVTPGGYYQSYNKINRWGNDFLWADPGFDNPPVIHILDGKRMLKMGLLICRDIRDKATEKGSYFYDPGDADIVAMSANWGDGGFPAVTWMEFAKDNKCVLVVANRYGKELPNNFGEGGVCVIHPHGLVECEGLKWSEPCFVMGEI